MMTSRKLVDDLAAGPFRPFYTNMTSGQSFEIGHPEMVLVDRTTVKVRGPVGDGEHSPEDGYDVSMMLRESIEPMAAAKA